MDKKKIIAIVVPVVILLFITILLFCLTNKKYTVSFDSKGGTEIASQVIEKGKNLEEPKAPAKEGYEFLGWYISENSEVKFNFDDEIEKDMTLVAKWKKIEVNDRKVIKIEAEKSEIKPNEEISLSLIMSNGDNAQDLEVTWTSSDKSIATVDETGRVKGLKAGNTTIIAKVGDEELSFSITVKEVKVEKEENQDTNSNSNTSTNTNSNANSSTNASTTKNPTNTNKKPTTSTNKKPTTSTNNKPTTTTKPKPEKPTTSEPTETKEDKYNVSITATSSDPEGLTPQRKVVVTKNGTSISATAVCDANKKVITDASSNWKIDKSEASAITYVLINGTYYKISK